MACVPKHMSARQQLNDRISNWMTEAHIARRTYSRTGDCLLVAMILLYVLAWVWFPTTMAIWTTSSFIATAIYVVVRLQLRRNAKKRPQRLLSSCLMVEVPAAAENDAREPRVARMH